MEIKIGLPLSFSEIGQKDNQEDFVFPSPSEVKQDDRVFILCDGMGGHSHGEIASRTVATALGQYMKWHFPSDGIMTKEVFNEGLNYAYEQLNLVDDDAPKKMGTTLTVVCFHQDGCFCAHIGDSRIYIVRPSERRIVYRTEDHSLVNDLVRAGELTPEEAAAYPHKNVITRAMQPNQKKPAKAEIHNIQDIQSGDYVFQCCDGVLENLDENTLIDILSTPGTSDVQKLAAIRNVCLGRTKDNFTCYLTPVISVSSKLSIEEEAPFQHIDMLEKDNGVPPSGKNNVASILNRTISIRAKGWVWLVAIIAILACGFFILKTTSHKKEKMDTEQIENTISSRQWDRGTIFYREEPDSNNNPSSKPSRRLRKSKEYTEIKRIYGNQKNNR